MPSSCKELRVIGHNLNGFYLERCPSISKITTVFCNCKADFASAGNYEKYCTFSLTNQLLICLIFFSDNFEKNIGQVDIRSSPIYCHVQRTKKAPSKVGIINFNLGKLNIGGANCYELDNWCFHNT